jgi:hypothetical protein
MDISTLYAGVFFRVEGALKNFGEIKYENI